MKIFLKVISQNSILYRTIQGIRFGRSFPHLKRANFLPIFSCLFGSIICHFIVNLLIFLCVYISISICSIRLLYAHTCISRLIPCGVLGDNIALHASILTYIPHFIHVHYFCPTCPSVLGTLKFASL